MPLKREARVVGFDDGPFAFGDATVPVVGVVVRGAAYVEGVMRTEVAVDGDDATDRLLDLLRTSRHGRDARLVLLDGIAFGGFNVVDLDRLHREAGVPVLAFTRGRPDLDAMEAALRAHVRDAAAKVELLRRHEPRLYRTEGQPVAVRAVGLDEAEVPAVLAATTVQGLAPEPLRLAHLVATAFVRGESRGQ